MNFPGGRYTLKMRLMTEEHVRRFLEGVEEYDRRCERARRFGIALRRPYHTGRWGMIFHLLLTYGARVSEAMMLRWCDVDFERKQLTFPTLKQWTKNKTTGQRHRKDVRRTLPLRESTAARLAEYRLTAPPGDLLFPYRGNPEYQRCVVRTAFKVILKRTGLPEYRLHDLRHTCLSRIAHFTRDLMVTGDVAGHANLQSTQPYLHAIEFEEKLTQVPEAGKPNPAPVPAAGNGRGQAGRCNHPAHWLFPYPEEVWEAALAFMEGCQPEATDRDDLLPMLDDWTADWKAKPPLSPEGRERLRLAIATYYAADDLLSMDPARRADSIRLACETTRGSGDALTALVWELAAGAESQDWLRRRWEAAVQETARYRKADYSIVAAELEDWPRLDVLRPAGA